MDIILCPKCGEKNWPDKVNCAWCQAPLDNAQTAQIVTAAAGQEPDTSKNPDISSHPPVTQIPSQPTVPQPPVDAKTQQIPTLDSPIGSIPELGSISSPVPKSPVIIAPAPIGGGYGVGNSSPAPSRPSRSQVVAQSGPGYTPYIIAGVVLFIGLIISLFNQQNMKPKLPVGRPEAVAASFIEGKRTGKIDNVKPYLSDNSIKILDNAFSSRAAKSAGITHSDVERMFLFDIPPTKEDLQYATDLQYKCVSTIDEMENGEAVIQISGVAKLSNGYDMPVEGAVVLTAEDTEWKVDIQATMGLVKQNMRYPGNR